MSFNQDAPAAAAPKQNGIKLDPFPESGNYILTLVAFNFIPNYENTRQDGTVEVFDALEFVFGGNTDKGYRFVKTWPTRYSIHEKANYSKLFKALTGKLPAPGSRPSELIGKALSADVENQNKVSKKGTAYVSSKIKNFGGVHPKLASEIVPAATLIPVLQKMLDENAKGEGNAATPKSGGAQVGTNTLRDDGDEPF